MKAKRTRLLQAALILFPLMLGGCEAASSLRAAGLSDPKLMKSINDAYEARDNCLTANIHLADSGNASAQSLAATAAASCQTQTDVLISLSNPYGDPRVTAAIQKDSNFRALRYVLKARGQG
ncbi:hypothetical protein [uncultured Reyranella sp.]|uniref:hypothetical protein n=1 Tax=uncultured Reyranella sp. TaxID=735512 RepID=UPI00259CBE2A|nr:hypothetical protein [uncultured Reyranella sp.]